MAVKIESFYVKLGKRIQERRTKRGMTQDRLGKELNPPTTRASIANMEAGKQRVLVHTLVQLAKILKIEISDLLPPRDESVGIELNIAKELGSKLHIPKDVVAKMIKQIEATYEKKSK